MDAERRNLQDLFTSQQQFIIPLFQRTYTWGSTEWRTLWDDLYNVAFETGGAKKRPTHFFGSLVMAPFDPAPGRVAQFFVVDGQQRLTTISLLLMAIRDVANELTLPTMVSEIHETLLVHKHKSGDERFKLLLREKDRIPYVAILDGQWYDGRQKVSRAFTYFKRQVSDLVAQLNDSSGTLAKLTDATTAGLEVVSIRLAADDSPFEIFASLNFKGVDLTEADLIRNYLFMKVGVNDQDAFNEAHWAPFDTELAGLLQLFPKARPDAASTFYRHFLMREGAYVRKNSAYIAFDREYKVKGWTPDGTVNDLAKHLDWYLGFVEPARLEGQDLAEVRRELELLQGLDVSTAYPLLLSLFARWKQGDISIDRLGVGLGLINSFVVRRILCDEGTRSYGQWFVAAIPPTSDPDPIETMKKSLATKGWPDDQSFMKGGLTFPLYRTPYDMPILTRLLREKEKALGGEASNISGCNVEHVLPQTVSNTDPKGQEWIQMLGPQWNRIHAERCDTLPNLTILGKGLNFKASNDPYRLKKPILASSTVALNASFRQLDKWDGTEMDARLIELMSLALAAFPCP